jgi:hypothetical protein
MASLTHALLAKKVQIQNKTVNRADLLSSKPVSGR